MNIEILQVEVTDVLVLDHRVARLLAEERVELLRRDAARGGRRERRGARERLGRALVGVGVRIAGARATSAA